MADKTSLIAFVVFGLFTSYCNGQCAFPGKPKNGSVVLHLEPRLANDINSQNSSLNATYSCDANHLLVPSNGRKCVEGRWDGEIPQCLEIKRVYQTPVTSDCQHIPPRHSYQFKIEEEAVVCFYLRVTNNTWNEFKNAVLTLKGRKNYQSKWENLKFTQTNYDFSLSSTLELINHSKSSKNHFKIFQFTTNVGVDICETTFSVYHDECGHPEVPLHGNVAYDPGDTDAIYWCNDGYQLNVPYDTRYCIRGKWNESQPICVTQAPRPTTTPRTTKITKSYTKPSTPQSSVSTPNSTTELFICESDKEQPVNHEVMYVVIGICSCLFTIVAMLLIILYRKNRKKGAVQDGSKPEDNQRTADSAHRKAPRFNPVDYADEDAESARDEYRKRYRREEMECDSPIYAEVADDNDGSSSVRRERQPQFIYANSHDVSHGVPIGGVSVWPDRQPRPVYANIHDVSQGVPIYAKIDKSKKTRRN